MTVIIILAFLVGVTLPGILIIYFVLSLLKKIIILNQKQKFIVSMVIYLLIGIILSTFLFNNKPVNLPRLSLYGVIYWPFYLLMLFGSG